MSVILNYTGVILLILNVLFVKMVTVSKIIIIIIIIIVYSPLKLHGQIHNYTQAKKIRPLKYEL